MTWVSFHCNVASKVTFKIELSHVIWFLSKVFGFCEIVPMDYLFSVTEFSQTKCPDWLRGICCNESFCLPLVAENFCTKLSLC